MHPCSSLGAIVSKTGHCDVGHAIHEGNWVHPMASSDNLAGLGVCSQGAIAIYSKPCKGTLGGSQMSRSLCSQLKICGSPLVGIAVTSYKDSVMQTMQISGIGT